MRRRQRAKQGNGSFWVIVFFVALIMVGTEYLYLVALIALVGGLAYLVVSLAGWRQRQPPAPANVSPGSCVYMLRAGPYYKIGKTKRFQRRLNQIELQLPYPVEVVHTIATDRISEVETYWHRRFKAKRTNGEWFVLNDADVAEFKQHSVM